MCWTDSFSPQNRHFTPGPAYALFKNACILGTSQSMPCWTSPEASCHGGKCTKIAGNRGTFPGRRKRQVRREGLVVPVPRQAIGESAPESREIAALSPRVETAGAARGACGAGAQTSYGGKCTRIAGNRGTFPGGGDGRCGERGLWCRCPDKLRGKVHQNSGESRHFPREAETASATRGACETGTQT